MKSNPEDRKIVTVEQMTRYIFNEGPIVAFDDLEPAPPKDWVPSCFMANSSNINKCAFPKRSIERLMNESCENCPFRKLEE